VLNVLENQFVNITEYFIEGGVIMYPLLFVSIVMWILIINRIIFFKKMGKKYISRKEALDYILSGNFDPDEMMYRDITGVIIGEFLKNRTCNSSLDAFIMDEIILKVLYSLDKYLNLISILATIAPLLGLLGTVIGMVKTFDVISFFGTGNPKAMASGISEALITTQTGLIIAIPGIYMNNFLNKRAYKLKLRVSSIGIFLRRHI